MEIANVDINEAIAALDEIAAELEQFGHVEIGAMQLKYVYKALAALESCKALGGR